MIFVTDLGDLDLAGRGVSAYSSFGCSFLRRLGCSLWFFLRRCLFRAILSPSCLPVRLGFFETGNKATRGAWNVLPLGFVSYRCLVDLVG